MELKKIIVVGSTNMDMVVKTTYIPEPGETVLGGTFFMNAGGKGANQAVACARLGGEVIFVSKMGNDVFGKQAFRLYDEEGIDTSFIVSDEELPSGVALITVDDNGQNSIVVAPGANAALGAAEVESALRNISDKHIVLLQLEIPLETVHFVVQQAATKGAWVILNPAPAASLSPDLLQYIDLITPNETEASILSGIKVINLETAKLAARKIRNLGVKNVVVTMGELGALLLEDDEFHKVETPTVQPIDTTAAGDVFNGALAVALSEGKKLVDAVGFACIAASISVTKMGAQSSIPYRNELIAYKIAI
ncbi:MAG: rbsK [Sediminibacterium sp.]|nr:rbsK [Sediminibacterium sp.]